MFVDFPIYSVFERPHELSRLHNLRNVKNIVDFFNNLLDKADRWFENKLKKKADNDYFVIYIDCALTVTVHCLLLI